MYLTYRIGYDVILPSRVLIRFELKTYISLIGVGDDVFKSRLQACFLSNAPSAALAALNACLRDVRSATLAWSCIWINSELAKWPGFSACWVGKQTSRIDDWVHYQHFYSCKLQHSTYLGYMFTFFFCSFKPLPVESLSHSSDSLAFFYKPVI